MQPRNSIRQRRKRAKQMGPWETDENGNFAREMPVIDPIAFLGAIPLLGAFYAIAMIASGHMIDGWATGVSQQAIRGGHAGLVAQLVWFAVFVIGISL